MPWERAFVSKQGWQSRQAAHPYSDYFPCNADEGNLDATRLRARRVCHDAHGRENRKWADCEKLGSADPRLD